MRKENQRLQRQRVWEVDAYRGLNILLILILHMYITVDSFCIDGYYKIDSYAFVDAVDPYHLFFDWNGDGVIYRAAFNPMIIAIWIQLVVSSLFFTSGVCCSFSKNGMNRVLRLFAAGLFVSVFTFGLYLWTGDEQRFIRFGALMCHACCHLIFYGLLEKRSNTFLVALAIPIIIGGYYLMKNPIYTNSGILYAFGFRQNGVTNGDHIPLLPFLGWMLLGVVCGRVVYPQKKSILHVPWLEKLTRPLQWMGRYGGQIYVAHIVVYAVVFSAIGYIFHLF